MGRLLMLVMKRGRLGVGELTSRSLKHLPPACRYMRRLQHKTGEYALLATSDAADGDAFEGGVSGNPEPKKKGWRLW